MSEQPEAATPNNATAPVIAATPAAPAAAAPVETEEKTLLGSAEEGSPEKPADADPAKEKEPEAKKDPAAEKVIPEKYEFKVPEGMEIDLAAVDLFTPIFKELGIDQAGAQKLVDAYAPIIQASEKKLHEANLKMFKEMVDGWKTESMKELGAESKSAIAACGKALNKFGSPELRELMDETGVGNHKEMVKFMAKVGKLVSEDTVADPVGAKPAGGNPLDKMYPTMVNQ